jgi:hypothetical protein
MRTAAQLLMEQETRVGYGPVPHIIDGAPLPEMHWQLHNGTFLLRGIGQHYFHYEKGKGITVERGAGADLTDEPLWLNGSVYSAVASMNGLLPVHASAVVMNGSVIAFTGPGGAGKSTLVAALGSRGLPMFCDDTLLLDLSDPDGIRCLPGHKRLKLRPDAFSLTGAIREERVSRETPKFYARPASGDVGIVLPLGALIFLEDGDDPVVIPISGGERIIRLQDDHYTARLFHTARQLDPGAQFSHYVRLARQIAMSRFSRPPDKQRFDESLDVLLQHLAAS